MGFKIEAGEGKAPAEQREISKKGPRVAVISGIIDLGIQEQEYEGEKQRDCREFLPIFTLVNDFYTDDEGVKHNMITSPWPVKIKLGDKANYVKFCNAADPNQEVMVDGVGDLSDLLGRKVFANMVHTKGKGDNAEITYANCKGISELPEDYPCEEIEINRIIFDAQSPDADVFEKLWDRTKVLIRKGVDWDESRLKAGSTTTVADPVDSEQAAAGTEIPDDDIPF